MNIALMKESDVPKAHAIQCLAFEKRWHEPLEIFQYMQKLYSQGCFTLKQNEQTIGYIFTQPADDNRNDYEHADWDIRGDETCLFIHDLCIDPKYQGQGIAQQAAGHIESFAKQNEFQKLIGVAIEGVEKFWEKQGFTMLRPYLYNGEKATFMEKVIR